MVVQFIKTCNCAAFCALAVCNSMAIVPTIVTGIHFSLSCRGLCNCNTQSVHLISTQSPFHIFPLSFSLSVSFQSQSAACFFFYIPPPISPHFSPLLLWWYTIILVETSNHFFPSLWSMSNAMKMAYISNKSIATLQLFITTTFLPWFFFLRPCNC